MDIKMIEFMKGKLRLLILHMLSKEPKHGYSIMKEFEDLIGYSPSPGTIYPLLKDMLKNGLISVKVIDEGKGRSTKVYSITKKGVEYLSEYKEELSRILTFAESMKILRNMGLTRISKIFRRLMEVLPSMNEEQRSKIAMLLNDCSKKLLEVIEEVEISE